MKNEFLEKGFTQILEISFNNELLALQKLIYENTKDNLINHDSNLKIEDKLILPFSEAPTDNSWSKLMYTINNSNELKNVIQSEQVKKTFLNILDNPILFDVCPFRARLPIKKKSIYGWHQDEATWFLSTRSNIKDKFPPVLWLSINGSNKTNSIQLVKYSHKKKIYQHTMVNGQGYFNIKNPEKFLQDDNIYTVETKPSEGIIFHPATVHRSVVPIVDTKLIPRYSVDIRYYDKNFRPKLAIDMSFRLRKLINIVSGQKW